MARAKPVHVVPQDGRGLSDGGQPVGSSLHDTQAEAERGWPTSSPRAKQTEFYPHGRDGQIRQ